NTKCQVINHSPICSCQTSYLGDPFTRCYPPPPPVVTEITTVVHPCTPSPCGPNSQCREISNLPSCSCLPEFIGAPPNCRPECSIHSECSSNLACIRRKCIDPCPGACGLNAVCNVFNYHATCSCPSDMTGDPFNNCFPKPPEPVPAVTVNDPCNPSPCGANALCEGNGRCACIQDYQGDPYRGCRPECVVNNDCPRERSCIRRKCVDPCIGTCASTGICQVINHIPMCSCPPGSTGNAFVACRTIEIPQNLNPCNPTPCGPNSQCREINQQAVCSCLPGYVGSPPICRPECVSSSECSLLNACINQKCVDPCPGTCGIGAKCQVINHNPICTCPSDFIGDPFTRCFPK
uniref:Neurogenic locus notch homolog protein 2-like n=1 Tax=Diabrotica virgifera virgifera TaxID=50390 RepID=A0A6P7H9Z1_DIAVI